MAQSSGKKHGYTESLPYVDTVCIHEGGVCLPGKHGKSELVRLPLHAYACMCVCTERLGGGMHKGAPVLSYDFIFITSVYNSHKLHVINF